MKCRLCLAQQIVPFSQEHRGDQIFTIIHCQVCDAIQTVEHYNAVSPDYTALLTTALDDKHLWCQDTHKQAAFRQWRTLMRHCAMPQTGRLLDVGCGTGGFLRYAAQQGWEVFGFDASQVQADHARHSDPKLANVRHATRCTDYMAQMAAPEMQFAIITLWDVFEHIREPKSFLNEIRHLLQPDGLLFLSVPNGGALSWKMQAHRLFGKNLSLDPWEHVFYYSPATLQRLLPAWGFHLQKIGSTVCYPRPWSLFEMARRSGFFLLNRIPTLAPQIYCIARKVNHHECSKCTMHDVS